MSAWIGRVKAFAFKLCDIGVDRILTLNGSYESFDISLDAPADLTLDYAVDRLLNEEIRRGNTS
jgi:hypothetical protein